ncbi:MULTISPECIES: winged helix-turn-helix domain-containing tetratricopeptide repeat protein [Ramlibacter]|nr:MULTISPECIES: winged helix-turn-helix domain-containing protein [Ramlibacter]MBA2965137.1 winged helix-turn-helix domain-containing protein [Ramlibacter sp. CGMCC 1.13660]
MDEPASRAPAAASRDGRIALGRHVLDLRAEVLLDAESGAPVALRPQVWAVLRHLARNAGHLVTKEDLLDTAWPGMVVSESSVAQAVFEARVALGDADHRVVRTVPRRGYLLVAGPGPLAVASPAAAATGSDDPPFALSVAVLPFDDPFGEPAGRQLARGLAQELIAALARNVGLRVVSHHSSFQFAGGATPLAQIGERLRCRYLVDGTVRRDCDTLQISMELIDSHSGEIVWSQRYSAGSADALAQRDSMVELIAGTVLSRVIHTRDRQSLARPPRSMDAYTLTLRSIALRREASVQSFREARGLLEQALAIDPDYGPAWSALGFLNALDIALAMTGEWDLQRIGEAAAQAERAISLGFEEAIAQVALSFVRRVERRFEESLRAGELAVRAGPNDVNAWHILALAQYCVGRAAEALCSAERAIALNPIPSGWTLANWAGPLWAVRRHEDAIRVASEALVKLPTLWTCIIPRMYALAESGRVAEARADAGRLLARPQRSTTATLADTVADEAVELRARIISAARAAGIPD